MRITTISKCITLAIALICVAPTFASDKDGLNHRDKKEVQKMAKNLKKEGWDISGDSRTLERAMEMHREKVNMGYQEVVGEVSGGRSINAVSMVAINNAINKYCALEGSYLRGRVSSDQMLNQSVSGEEFDKFYSAYERLVSVEIRGELHSSYSIVRKDKKGNIIEYRAFFYVDREAASKARMEALERLNEETELAQQYGISISDFIKEGFASNADMKPVTFANGTKFVH